MIKACVQDGFCSGAVSLSFSVATLFVYFTLVIAADRIRLCSHDVESITIMSDETIIDIFFSLDLQDLTVQNSCPRTCPPVRRVSRTDWTSAKSYPFWSRPAKHGPLCPAASVRRPSLSFRHQQRAIFRGDLTKTKRWFVGNVSWECILLQKNLRKW